MSHVKSEASIDKLYTFPSSAAQHLRALKDVLDGGAHEGPDILHDGFPELSHNQEVFYACRLERQAQNIQIVVRTPVSLLRSDHMVVAIQPAGSKSRDAQSVQVSIETADL